MCIQKGLNKHYSLVSNIKADTDFALIVHSLQIDLQKLKEVSVLLDSLLIQHFDDLHRATYIFNFENSYILVCKLISPH